MRRALPAVFDGEHVGARRTNRIDDTGELSGHVGHPDPEGSEPARGLQSLPQHLIEEQRIDIGITYKQVELNKEVRFPYKIPKGYNPITAK